MRRLSEEAIYRICARRAREAGVPPFTPHDMCRTYISTLLDRGVDLSIVSKPIGHASGPAFTTYRHHCNNKRPALPLPLCVGRVLDSVADQMQTASTSARFTRTGRVYHLDIATAVDLRNTLGLNEAHWVATSAPIDTLHLDALFLKLVDSDHDGRIKPRELKDAIRWCLEVLCDFRGLDAGDESLALATINTRAEDGRRAHEAAIKLLLQQADEAASHVSLDQVRQVRRHIECMVRPQRENFSKF